LPLILDVAAGLLVATTVAPDFNVIVTGALAAKPVPSRVRVDPAAAFDGIPVMAAAADATPTLASAPPADPMVARGAANSIGRLLRSSAAVSVNAAKLLRSEFKVPSSSEIMIRFR